MAEPPLSGQLTDVGEALLNAFTRGEPALLAVGDRLGEAIGIFSRLGDVFEALRASLDDPELSCAAATLGAVGRDIAVLAAALEEEEAALSRLQTLTAQVARRIEVIRRAIRAISMLAVNAHISASDVDAEGEDVASFSLRFSQLAKSARSIVADAAAQCERLGKVLDAARRRQSRFMLEHDRALALMAERIEAGARAIDARRATAAEASRTIGAGSQQLSADVSTVVMALQIGDITRQRLDHVAEALTTLAQMPGEMGDATTDADAEEPGWWVGLDVDDRAALGSEVCRLEAAQLTQTERDFDRELDRAADSLRRLALEVARLVGLGARGYGSGQDGFAASLAALQAELDTAVLLFRVCQKERTRVDAGMTVAAQTLQQLLDQLAAVERIEEDIRLVSLNTAFLCQRIGGKGRVLAVIAQELRSRASRMLEDCRRLFSLVDEIGGVARRFEQIRDGHGAQRMAAMEQIINASLQPLRRGGTDIALALAGLGSEGSAAGQTLRGSVATLAGLDDLGCTLRALCRRLHRLAGDVPAHVDRRLLRERLRLFPVCYTMASERAVHAAICGVEAAEAPTPLTDPTSDVLF